MNEQKYNNLKTSIKEIFKDDTEIAKDIKNLVEHLADDFQATMQDVLFVTMKEFTNKYNSESVLQYYHYLGNVERDELADMLNFLDLQKLEEYKQEFKENEIKRREVLKRNKEVLTEIIKLQDKILNQK